MLLVASLVEKKKKEKALKREARVKRIFIVHTVTLDALGWKRRKIKF